MFWERTQLQPWTEKGVCSGFWVESVTLYPWAQPQLLPVPYPLSSMLVGQVKKA